MPLPPSKRATFAAAALFSLTPATASAQLAASVHAVGEASIGWTDNALSQPRATQSVQVGQGTQTAQGGVVEATFLTFRPGAFVVIEGRKTLQRVQYTFTSTHYLGHSEANSTGHQLSYNMLYALSKRSELIGGVGATYGNQNIFNLMRQPASNAGGTAVPPGNLSFLTIAAYQSYTHDYTTDWRFIQSSAISAYSVIDVTPPQPTRFTIDERVGTERRFGRNSLIGEVSASYLATTALEYGGFRTPFQSQLLTGITGRWRRDLNDHFSSELSTGVTTAFNPSDTSTITGPVIGGALRFHDDYGEATVGYNRSFTPNVFLGQIFYGDSVFANGTVPVFEETTHLRFSTGAGMGWSNLVDANVGRLTSTLRVFSADVALTWDAHNGIYASLRYQYYNQKGNPDDDRPLFDFTRNSAFFTIGGTFPYEYGRSTVPREPSTRVDRSDRPEASTDFERANRNLPSTLAPSPGTNRNLPPAQSRPPL
jgi:hypothetical protein